MTSKFLFTRGAVGATATQKVLDVCRRGAKFFSSTSRAKVVPADNSHFAAARKRFLFTPAGVHTTAGIIMTTNSPRPRLPEKAGKGLLEATESANSKQNGRLPVCDASPDISWAPSPTEGECLLGF